MKDKIIIYQFENPCDLEPEPDDREPLTPDEEWEQWKFIDNILNPIV